MKRSRIGMVAAAVMLTAGATAFAAEPQGWKFELSPYAWLTGIEGDATVRGHEAEFDKSFGDLFDSVELGASVSLLAQYNRFLIRGAVDYFQLDSDRMDVDDQPQHGSLETKTLLGEVGVGYQIDGWMEGQTFDFLIGARMLKMESDLKVDGRGTFSKDNDLVDPILFVRPHLPLFPSKIKGLSLNPMFGIGGGGDADLVYELYPQLQYDVNETFSMRLGYRTVGYKFKGDENEDNELNINMSGLTLGCGITF